jgi:hypothetical protein
LLAHGRWFSPGTPTSSTTKTGRHDTAEIAMHAIYLNKRSLTRSITTMSMIDFIYFWCFKESQVIS